MKGFLFCCFIGLLATVCVAGDKTRPAHSSATVLKVQKHETGSPYVRRKLTDTPLSAYVQLYRVEPGAA